MTVSPTPVGHFRWSRQSDEWWWSEGMFALLGMEPGDAPSSRDVFLWHVHPSDREDVAEALLGSWTADTACEYRLVDLRGNEHVAVLALTGDPSEGTREAVLGLVTDISLSRRRALAAEVSDQLQIALDARTVVDQAKGALMLIYGITAPAAFDILRTISQSRNVRVHDLADRILRAVQSPGALTPHARVTVDDLISRALDDEMPSPSASTGRLSVRRTVASDGTPVLTVHGSLDLAAYGELAPALGALVLGARRAARAVVDLRSVEHLAVPVAECLATFQRRSRSTGVKVALLLPSGEVRTARASGARSGGVSPARAQA